MLYTSNWILCTCLATRIWQRTMPVRLLLPSAPLFGFFVLIPWRFFFCTCHSCVYCCNRRPMGATVTVCNASHLTEGPALRTEPPCSWEVHPESDSEYLKLDTVTQVKQVCEHLSFITICFWMLATFLPSASDLDSKKKCLRSTLESLEFFIWTN